MNYWNQWDLEDIIGHADIQQDEDNDYDYEAEQEEPHCHCRGRGCNDCLL